MYEGTIKTIIIDRGFGFIAVPNQPDCFFHASELSDDLPFDELLTERRVLFDIVESGKGPRAANVRPAE